MSGSASDNGTSPAWRAASDGFPIAGCIPDIRAFSSTLSPSENCISLNLIIAANRFFILSTGSAVASSRNGSRSSLRGKRPAKYVSALTKQSNSVSCCNLHHITLQAQWLREVCTSPTPLKYEQQTQLTEKKCVSLYGEAHYVTPCSAIK